MRMPRAVVRALIVSLPSCSDQRDRGTDKIIVIPKMSTDHEVSYQ